MALIVTGVDSTVTGYGETAGRIFSRVDSRCLKWTLFMVPARAKLHWSFLGIVYQTRKVRWTHLDRL